MSKLQQAEKLVDFILDGMYNEAMKKVDEYLEHTDNDMPEVPKPKGTAAKDIKQALTNSKSTVKKIGKDPIDNIVSREKGAGAKRFKKAMEMK